MCITIIRSIPILDLSIPILDYQSPSVYYYHTIDTYTGLLVPEGIIHYHTIDTYTGLLVPECVLLSYDRYLYWTISPRVCITIIRSIPILDYQSPSVYYYHTIDTYTGLLVPEYYYHTIDTIIRSIPILDYQSPSVYYYHTIDTYTGLLVPECVLLSYDYLYIRSIPILDYQSPSVYYYHTIDTYTGLLVPECVLLSYDRYLYWTISPRVCIIITTIIRSIPILDYQSPSVYYYHTIDTYTGLLVPECVLLSYDRYLYWTISPRVCITIIRSIPILDYQSPSVYYYHTIDTYTGLLVPECVLLSYDRYLYWTIGLLVPECVLLSYDRYLYWTISPRGYHSLLSYDRAYTIRSIPILDYQSPSGLLDRYLYPSVYYYHTIDTYTGLLVPECVLLSYDRYLYWTISPRVCITIIRSIPILDYQSPRVSFTTIIRSIPILDYQSPSPRYTIIRSIPILDYQSPRVSFTTIIRSIPILDYQSPSVYYYHTIDTYTGLLVPECVLLSYDRYLYGLYSPSVYYYHTDYQSPSVSFTTIIRSIPILDYQSPSVYYYHTIDTYTGLLVPEGIIHYYHTIDTYTGLLVPECVLLSYDRYLYWTISPRGYYSLLSYDRYLYWTISPRVCITIIRSIPILDYQSPRVSFTTIIRSIPILDYQSPSVYYYHTIDTYTGLLVPECVLLSYDRYLYWTISPRVCITIIRSIPILDYQSPSVYYYHTIDTYTGLLVCITIIRSIPILDYLSPSVYYYHTIDTYTGLLVPECVLLSYDRYLYWTISPRVCITIIRSIPILDYQSPRVSFTTIIRSIPILDYQSPSVYYYHTIDTYTGLLVPECVLLSYDRYLYWTISPRGYHSLLSYDRYLYWTISPRVCITIIRSIPILDYQSPRVSFTTIIRSIPILDYQSPSVYYYHTIDTYTGLLVPECVLLSYDRYLYWTISPRGYHSLLSYDRYLYWTISPRVCITIIRSIPILDYQSPSVYYYHTIDTYTGLLVPKCVLLSYDRYLYWTISPRVCITIIRSIPILDYLSPSVYYYHTIDTYTGLLVPECVLLSYDRYLYWTISPRVCITIIRSIPILVPDYQSIPILESPCVLLSYDRYLYWTISPRGYHSLISYDRYLYWTISPRVCLTIIRSIPILDYQSPSVYYYHTIYLYWTISPRVCITIIRSIPILDYQSPSVYYYHTIDTYTGLLVPECVLLSCDRYLYWTISLRGYHPLLSYDRYLYWTISPRVCITIIRSIPILDYQSPSVYYYHTIDTYTGLLVPECVFIRLPIHTIDTYTGLLVPEGIIHYYHTIDTYTGLLVPECVLLSYDRYLYWTISPRVCITIIRSIPILDYQSPSVYYYHTIDTYTGLLVPECVLLSSIGTYDRYLYWTISPRVCITIIRSIPILDYQSPSVYYYHMIDYTGLLVILSYDRYLYWTISPRVCITIIRSIPILDYQSPRVSFTTIIRSIPILDYQSPSVYYYHTIDTYTGLLVPECVLLSYDRYLYWTISPRVCITIIRSIPILDYQSPSVYYYHTTTYTYDRYLYWTISPRGYHPLLSYDRYLYWTISPRVCITIIRLPILDIRSIPILDYQSPSVYYYHTIDTYTGLLVPECVLLSYDRYLYWTISPRVCITIIRSIPILDYQSPSVYYYHTIDTYTGLLVPECVLLSYDRYLYWTISPRVCITIIRSIPILDYQSPSVYYYHTIDTYTGLLVPECVLLSYDYLYIRSIPILDYQSPSVYYYHTIDTYTGLLVPEGIINYYHTIDTYTGLLVPECVLLSYDRYLYWTISPRVCITIIRSIPILDYQSPRVSFTTIIRSIPILDYQSPSVYYYHTIDTYTGLLVPEGIIHYYHTIDTYTGLLVPECVLLSYDRYLYWTISPRGYHSLLSYDRYLYWTISPRVCITIIRSIPILDYQSPRVSFTIIIRSIPILDYQSPSVYYYHTIDTYTGLLVPEGIIHYYHTIDTYTGLLVPEIPILYLSPSVYYYHTIDTYTGLLVPECVLLSYDRYLYWTISPRVCITIIRSIPILDYQSPSVYYYLATTYTYDRYLYWTISPRVCITIIRSIPILDYQSPRVSFTIIRSIPILDYQSPSVYYYHAIDTYTGLLVPECVLLSYDRYLYWTISPRVCITIIRSIPTYTGLSYDRYLYWTISPRVYYYHTIDTYTGLLVPECVLLSYDRYLYYQSPTITSLQNYQSPYHSLLSYDRYLYWTISPRVCITIIRSIPILDYQSPRVSFTTIIRSIPILVYQSPSVYYYHTIDTYTDYQSPRCHPLLSYDRYLYWTISPRVYYYYYHTIDTYTGLLVPECVLLSYDRYLY